MPPERSAVNCVRDQLARLRAAITGRRHWVIATDLPRNGTAGLALRGLPVMLVSLGVCRRGELTVAIPDVVLGVSGGFPLTAVAVPKDVFPAEVLVEFLAGIAGGDPAAYRTSIAAGTDQFSLGRDPAEVAAVVGRIARGAPVLDPANN
ncbi:hypothetical protein [Gemmata sp.]|uniref:hypothetical protein n=1 Tax=Gemmata sp. TaxID=1914242 RepID=UPI003F6F2473